MMRWLGTVFALAATTPAVGQGSFVNWESPHVHPADLTPAGDRLLVVNTADNRLEVFDVSSAGLTHAGSIPVGLDPVSVRARTNVEAWVVNHVSDTVSVVDLALLNVTATLPTGDEPADVVFAGTPVRAFVSVSQLNQVRVFDPADPGAAPTILEVAGEDPRALATDGAKVYAAVFESGNLTTVIGENVVSSNVNPYPGNPNPPPNSGSGFDPPIDGALPAPPDVSQILRRADGAWLDDNGGDWSAAVGWDLHDHDVAVIDADSLAISYVTGVMNANMNLDLTATGDVVVIGTEALNHVRFETNLQGVFLRVQAALVPAGAASPSAIVDLNPHLGYDVATIPMNERETSLGDPRGLACAADGTIYVTGLGSNNLVALTPGLGRVALAEVGTGPTAVVVDATHDRLYVVNRFEATISSLDRASLVELDRPGFHDPTPATIVEGRPFLYDTHETSGLGHVSCASCHIDGRMDQLAWDLGDPTGEMTPFDQVCNFGFGGCEDWHPMKGPMATQTLVGIIGTEPFHWRADRPDLAAFNGAFESLLGDDEQLTDDEMIAFTLFVASLRTPPNPYREIDGSLRTSLFNGGDAAEGENLFLNEPLDGGALTCVTCHALPTGTNGTLTSADLLGESQSMKIPQLRNMHEKTGFDATSQSNNRGFGYIHDGSTPTLFDFLEFPAFTFSNDQERLDMEAFLLSFATDTHAGVGVQATMGGPIDQSTRRDEMVSIADGGAVGLVAHGRVEGLARGFAYLGGGTFQSDRLSEVVSIAFLDAAATPGAEITYTLVPAVSTTRIGIDRDEDGFFDRDELDACADPADARSTPGDASCAGDVDGNGVVAVPDLLAVLAAWGGPDPEADVNCDGIVNVADLLALLAGWGPCR